MDVSLLKRGKVYWTYFYVDGVRYQFSTGTGNRRLAQRIERQRMEEVNTRSLGTIQADPSMTIAELAARFIAEGEAKRYHLERLAAFMPFFEHMPAVRTNQALTRHYRDRRRREKVTDSTINRDLSVLRRLLNWAVEEGLLTTNPLGRLRLVPEPRKHRPIMSLEERKVLRKAPGHLQNLIIAALDTGMRRGEILTQLWENVELEREVLFVTRSKTIGGQGREIPLTRRLFSLMRDQPSKKGHVFTFEGRPVHYIQTSWKSTLRRARVRHFRFHDLRHAFNTRLMEAGVLQEVRMALMGHQNPQRVHSMYTHIELPPKREAIAKLESWVNRQTNHEEES